MSLLVDLQSTPNRVFELVKQRIMANRARLLKRQDDNSVKAAASRRPRPQRARFGARMDHYARPEPAAIKSADPTIGSVWAWWDATSPSSNPTSPATKLLLYPPGVKVTGPNFASKLNYATTNLEEDQYKVVDFGIRNFPSVEHLRPPIVSYGGPYNSQYTKWAGKSSLVSVNPFDNTWTFQTWGPNLYDGTTGSEVNYTFVTLPLGSLPQPASHTDESYWFYINQDQISYKNILMLPVGDNTNIVIVVAREVKASHVHMINYVDNWQGNIGTDPNNNQPTHYYTGQVTASIGPTYSVASDVLFSNHYFIVSENKIRQLDAPQVIEALINKLYPDPSLGTAAYSTFTSGVSHEAGYSYGPGGNVPSGQYLTPQIPMINYDAYFGHSPYQDDLRGEYSGLNEETRIFSRHFGMGNYVRSYHASITYFTPAIYTWLKGQMNLSHNNELNLAYAGYRQDYFANAPSLYVDPSVGENNIDWDMTDRVGITRQTPVRVDQAMPFGAFTQRKKLENSQATYISWDWGNKSYCRRQALDLGFQEADLTP